MKKVLNYLAGVARAIAGKEKKQDYDSLSQAMVLGLRDKGYEIRKINDVVADLTPQEILALPSFELIADGVVVGNVNFMHVFRGMWKDGDFGVNPEVDNAREMLAAITILQAFKDSGYARVQFVPPPQC